jgi:hypothetical protein
MVKSSINDTAKESFSAKVIPSHMSGGFAKCYEGINLETKQLVAIKVV